MQLKNTFMTENFPRRAKSIDFLKKLLFQGQHRRHAKMLALYLEIVTSIGPSVKEALQMFCTYLCGWWWSRWLLGFRAFLFSLKTLSESCHLLSQARQLLLPGLGERLELHLLLDQSLALRLHHCDLMPQIVVNFHQPVLLLLQLKDTWVLHEKLIIRVKWKLVSFRTQNEIHVVLFVVNKWLIVNYYFFYFWPWNQEQHNH